MIKGRDIVVMGIQAWDIEIGSNCKNIALEMAVHNRVLYINQPLDRKSKFSERNTPKVKSRLEVLRGDKPALEQIGDQLWILNPKTILESANFLPDGPLFDWINLLNNRRFAKAVIPFLEQLNFSDFILFNDSSMFIGLHQRELLKPSVYVYYMRDYLVKNPYWGKHGRRIEPKLIARADVVTNNSLLYTDYASRYNERSYMVGQGCDVDAYNDIKHDIPVATDLQNLPKPLIGYVGYLSSRRLNIDLLEQLAKKMNDKSFVLVGPEDDTFKGSGLHQLENVYFLGARKPEELPAYIKGFDVCLNPQLINDATIGNYPRKIDEYLAMGKPVVATATKAMEYFSKHTYLGETASEYELLIVRALAENSSELEAERRSFAWGHTWQNNVNLIYQAILDFERSDNKQ